MVQLISARVPRAGAGYSAGSQRASYLVLPTFGRIGQFGQDAFDAFHNNLLLFELIEGGLFAEFRGELDGAAKGELPDGFALKQGTRRKSADGSGSRLRASASSYRVALRGLGIGWRLLRCRGFGWRRVDGTAEEFEFSLFVGVLSEVAESGS
jgi:hypothetical protein